MLCLPAFAKLNLSLRVLGRRPDGYHELETLFERIDLCDELTFEPLERDIRLTCDEPSLPCGEDNLILKAARALQKATGTPQGVAMHLTKRIPIAGGLGGGSSNAATTLIGLNRLWQTGCSQSALLALASRLGSDVPFFLWDVPFAIGRGRGELIEPVDVTSYLVHVMVNPGIPVSTREIFTGAQFGPSAPPEDRIQRKTDGFDLTADRPSTTILLHALRNGSLGELAKGLVNDLEPEAIRRCPVIQDLHARLREGGCLATLTSGSGPTVFGLCHDVAQAQQVAGHIHTHGPKAWRVWAVQTRLQGRGAAASLIDEAR